MDRFDVKRGNIIDYNSKKELSIGEVCDLLNSLSDFCNRSYNEVNRLEEGLVDLDIMIGELSWYVDDDSLYSLNDIQGLSLKLSECITNVMYPKFENIESVSGFR